MNIPSIKQCINYSLPEVVTRLTARPLIRAAYAGNVCQTSYTLPSPIYVNQMNYLKVVPRLRIVLNMILSADANNVVENII
jgi:hypothetical protein